MTTTADTVIRAAGAVLWRPSGQVALVHRPRYDDWSLPKGKLDDGETAPAAAVREVHEETGFHAELGRRLGRASYVVTSPAAKRTGPKVVDYWAARAVDGSFVPGSEVDELRWLAPDEAEALLTHAVDRAILESFTTVPVPTATILVVRHAKAGSRSRWHGDDDLRPLTPAGRRQADELRSLLGLFGPTRVHSASPVRCRQTVEPLAAALGTDVVDEPLLSEDGYWPDRSAGRDHFLQLAASPGTLVVCSQGGVIPDLVHELAGPAAADDTGTIPCKKASTWILSLRHTQLLAADHYPPP